MNKQNHEIRFKCSKEEHDLILRKAKEAKTTIKEFILEVTKKANVRIYVEVE